MNTECIPSHHLYMDWETAMRRIAVLFNMIGEADRKSAACLAHLGLNIAQDQLVVAQSQWEAERNPQKNPTTPTTPNDPVPPPLRAPTIELVDGAGQVRVRLELDAETGSLVISDSRHRELLRVPTYPEGEGQDV